MRVLLIEDEPTTAKAIELMLTTEGFNVYTTDLGEEGLDLVDGVAPRNCRGHEQPHRSYKARSLLGLRCRRAFGGPVT